MKRDNSYLIGNQWALGNKPNSTSFRKGQEPWNKNLKGVHLSRSSEFKKGQRGIHYVPVGTVRVRVDKSGKHRRWIKTSDAGKRQFQWTIYATWLWEQKHGKIPAGLLIHHLDGDSMNDALSNYALVTRARHIEIHRNDLLAAKKKRRTDITPGLAL
jgi:hypothetical protein